MTDLESLCSHGFLAEEATIALDRNGRDSSVTAALVLLLQRLAPESESETASPAVADLLSEQGALREEAVALQAIYDDAFSLEELPGSVQCLRLQLPDLQPVAGELQLLVPPGCSYPSQPCLPLFVPSAVGGALDVPGVRVSLASALAQQAARLAADGTPACHELSTWLAEELRGFLAQPPPRPPPLLLTAKQQAKQQHSKNLGARHQAAAEAASDLERHREREAAAHGMTFEEYLKATDAWPVCQGVPDSIEVAALKARLAAGPQGRPPRACEIDTQEP